MSDYISAVSAVPPAFIGACFALAVLRVVGGFFRVS